ncbi:hypothetical protein N9V13_01420 [Betaproteobacteria bacterium]|nr:hypothetical protein [Betaproteobacteria bacterium]
MPEKTSTASESSLGMMEGLRSYVPNQGWEELGPEKKEDSANEPKEDEFFADEYEPIPNTQVEDTEKTPDLEEDFLEQELTDINDNASIDSLARKVAQTNSLVDSALGNRKDNTKKDTDSVKKLDQLGTSLSDLFSDLYKEPPQTAVSPWESVSDAFDQLSSEVKKREDLRKQLTSTQEKINSCRKDLIKTIERLAYDEQERLTVVKMRSRLATVMADKLLKKLK